DDNITHVEGRIDPIGDIETINLDLILADLESVNKRYSRVEKMGKAKEKGAAAEFGVLLKIKPILADGKAVRTIDFTEEEQPIVIVLFLLTAKSVLYVANIAENEVDNTAKHYVQEVRKFAATEEAEVTAICAEIEEEIAELE